MQKPSKRIVERVAEAEGKDPSELPSLYRVIDLEALNELFETPLERSEQKEGEVRFEYLDYEIHVTAQGEVSVTPLHPS